MASVWTAIVTFIVSFFKKYWKQIIGVVLVLGLAITSAVYIKKYLNSQREVSTYAQNNKALMDRVKGAEGETYAMRLTVDDLRYMNDSISQKLLDAADRIKVKDRQIAQLQYLYTHFERRDSIVFQHDTIFKEPDFFIDTVIGDRWMSTEVQMRYPNVVCVSPMVRSEKSVVVHTKREPIRPSTCAFVNWFRKKHTVVKVVVDEANPHIESQQNVFIEITK